MTYEQIIKELNHGEKIYNLPLRVTYYCRVSTSSDIQLNSLDNQIDYYTNFIKKQKNWTLINGYIEQGVTGVRVDKRTCFKQMIKDAEQNKFDLIITKEVSRFARDLEDSIHYIRELKSYGVGILFENQNLNTFDDNSELILNIMFNLAQDESKKLSSRVKFGHKEAIKKGHVLGSSNILGYKKDKCKLVIVEEEAKLIKKIFELYATGEYGFYKLAKELSKLGYYNKKGKIYDKDTLKRIISNPKYKGFYRAHTYETIDYRSKKRKKIPLEEQIIYRCQNNEIPPIIDEELWDKANEILQKRTLKYKDNNYWSGSLKYPFSSKIYYEEQNTTFQRSHGRKKANKPTWSCGLYLHEKSSPILPELDLYNIMNHIMNYITPKNNNIIKDMIELYKNIEETNEYNTELNNIEKEIKNIEEKKTFALNLVYNKELKLEELKKQFIYLENEKNNLAKKKLNLLNQINIQKNNNIDKLYNYIKQELEKNLLEDFTRNFLSKIIVSKINNDRYNIKLDIYISFNNKEIDNINNYPLLSNQTYHSTKNNYTYNVYIL